MADRCILHVDMDAFFASIEQLDDPQLRGRPVLVGGASVRGVVAAASYEARALGCHSAMPMVRARRLCPQAHIARPRLGRYQEVSKAVFEVFRRYTPLVEGLSLDEAFLDVSGSQALFGAGAVIAQRIRDEIRAEVGITASAGVASSKFVAKIASDMDKPNGLTVVSPGEVEAFLHPLPIKRMWGVGAKAERRLLDAGYETIGDLAVASPTELVRHLGSWGAQVFELANGRDTRPVQGGGGAKSLGAENTFEKDLYTRVGIEKVLLKQSERVAQRLVRQSCSARVITVKLKYADFTQKTRQLKLEASVADTRSIFEVACSLLSRFPAFDRGVRLTGVSVSDIHDGPPERRLFPEPDRARRHALERVTASLRDRFGVRGLQRAALLDQPSEESAGVSGSDDESSYR